MFLATLEREERDYFINLAYKVANIDGEYSLEEQQLIEAYKQEMGLTEIQDSNSIEEIVKYFSSRSFLVQKIVWFEIFSMINADAKITSAEKEVSELIKNNFKIEFKILQEIEQIVITMNKAIFDAVNIIFSE